MNLQFIKQKKGSLEAVLFLILMLIAGFIGFLILDYFVLETVPISDDIIQDLNSSFDNSSEFAEYYEEYSSALGNMSKVKDWAFYGFLVTAIFSALTMAYYLRTIKRQY